MWLCLQIMQYSRKKKKISDITKWLLKGNIIIDRYREKYKQTIKITWYCYPQYMMIYDTNSSYWL